MKQFKTKKEKRNDSQSERITGLLRRDGVNPDGSKRPLAGENAAKESAS
ncbi:MAG TPA: hypothetical protein VHD63_11185 [Ktedonobacteraceae bacterium]|jgi:hypothetical protein|nr:hypothetical protein [Ktedonobacteraceae bacterium]